MDLSGIEAAASKAGANTALPPIHLWTPELSGDIDIRIDSTGAWFHDGTLIKRERLARLFSTIMRRETDDHYYLVTPVEKWRIQVEDAPFLAIDFDRAGDGEDQTVTFRTNLGDLVTADADHPIRMAIDPETDEPAPYVLVRDRLEARINRAMYYHLVDLGAEREISGTLMFGIWSGGTFFPFIAAAELEA